MTATLPPAIRFQPLVAGAPIPGGKVYFYQAGTTTPQAAYAADGVTPLANPLTLDANGATDFRLGTALTYKINVTDSLGGAITGWPVDQVTGLDGSLISLADTSSVALGDALVGVKQPFTGAVARTQHTKNAEFVSVTDFGAKGDGVTDDTSAFQAALNASRNVYVPPSASHYIVQPLVCALDGQTIWGAGYDSCLELKSGSIGDTISTNGFRAVIRGLQFYGGDPFGKGVGVITEPVAASANDRNGIGLNFDLDQTIDNVIINGYKNKGIRQINVANSAQHYGGTVITNSHIFQCWCGLDAGPNYAEYLRASDNTYNYCQIGIRSSSGNQTFVGGQSTDNYTNIQVFGTAIGNNSHSSCSGMLLNHATIYTLHCVDVTNGFVFNGCQLFYGSIWLQRSTGVIINNCIYDVAALNFEGGNRNTIRHCFSPNTQTNTVNHNYSGVTSNTVIEENFIAAGKSPLNTLQKVGKSTWTSGDEAFLQFGEGGAMEAYGFQWTSNAGTGVMKLFGVSNNVPNANPTLSILRSDGKIQSLFANLGNYANDAGAAGGGIPIGGFYRNGSVVQIRVT